MHSLCRMAEGGNLWNEYFHYDEHLFENQIDKLNVVNLVKLAEVFAYDSLSTL